MPGLVTAPGYMRACDRALIIGGVFLNLRARILEGIALRDARVSDRTRGPAIGELVIGLAYRHGGWDSGSRGAWINDRTRGPAIGELVIGLAYRYGGVTVALGDA